MIRIDVIRNHCGDIAGFSINGHANTAPHGSDIVCAGVSALTQTAVLGLEQYLGRRIRLDIAEGQLGMELYDSADSLTNAILETMMLGLREIAKLHPEVVRIREHRR